MKSILKGNLAEHAACCGHLQWWHEAMLGGRKPFALPGTQKQYAPDMPVNVHHIKLVLDVDPIARTLSGVCHTTVEAVGEEVRDLFFEAQDLVISSVSVANAADTLAFETSEHGFKVALPKGIKPGERLEIAVAYKIASPKLGIYFTGPSGLYPNKPYQMWTQGQDNDSHHWYPVAVADWPNHKMTSEVVVTVPEKFTALSNGKLVRETVNEPASADGDKTKTFHWLHDKPHVPYLVTLTVGVFSKLEQSFEDIPVELYCDPSLLPQAREYFKGTADLVALFSRLYGVRYPWPGKYAQVMVQDFIFGGMENTTMTTMTDRILADHRTRDEYRRLEIRLNAHELNHHWFGDLITCRDWSHGWLNEGGATYGEVEAIEHLYGKKERDYYVLGLARTYFGEDSRYRRPIVTNRYREPIDLFDRHLYQKGGLVRHMLRYLLGDEGYYRSMKTFLTDNAFAPAETHDLVKAIEKATGRNLREFFDQWVYGAGFPEYKLTYLWDDRNKVATVKVSQVQKLEGETGLFTMPVVMSFGFADGSYITRTVHINDKDESFNFAFDAKPTTFRFDPENWVLKTVDLSGVPKGMLIEQLKSDPEVMGRVNAALALAKVGGLDVVEALEAAANDGFFWGVSVEAVSCLGTVGTPAAREALKRLVKASNPFVRRAVVNALGTFKDDSVGEVLAGIVTGGEETSFFVLADACAALGKSKSPAAFDALKAALEIPSWNEVVRVGALNGLAELGDERAVELASDYAKGGKPWHARPAAIGALGKLGVKQSKAVDALHELARTEEAEQFTLRMSLIGALGEAKKPESASVLSQLGKTAHDGRVKRAVAETIEKLTGGTASGANSTEVEALKGTVTKLETTVRELSEKLERETLGATKKTARKRGASKRTGKTKKSA